MTLLKSAHVILTYYNKLQLNKNIETTIILRTFPSNIYESTEECMNGWRADYLCR